MAKILPPEDVKISFRRISLYLRNISHFSIFGPKSVIALIKVPYTHLTRVGTGWFHRRNVNMSMCFPLMTSSDYSHIRSGHHCFRCPPCRLVQGIGLNTTSVASLMAHPVEHLLHCVLDSRDYATCRMQWQRQICPSETRNVKKMLYVLQLLV